MTPSTPSPIRPYRRHLTAPALLLCAAALLVGCGSEKAGTTDAAAPPAATPATPTPSPSAPSPYVDPGVVDGAPHERENNAYRRPGEMSSTGQQDAHAEVARMEPVLKRLWRQKKWDPDSVRTALVRELGYEERSTTKKGELIGGELDVRAMYPRYVDTDYVTPEGAMIGLYMGDDACVTGFVQKTNYEVRANGRFMETGCIEPPTGH